MPWLLLVLFAFLRCASAGAPPVSTPILEDGLSLEREIHGGEVHGYPLEFQTGQFLRVFVQEDGVDLAVRLLDPKGDPVTGTDSLSRGHAEEKEDLAALVQEAGSYRLEVVASGKDPGRYRLKVEGPRTPGGEDQTRAEAVSLTWSGMVHPQGSPEEQIGFLERALPLWQSLQETRKSAEVSQILGLRRFSLQQYGQAILDFRRSASLWARIPTRTARLYYISALINLGHCLKRTESRKDAREAYAQALTLASETGDDNLHQQALDSLGLMETEDGEIRKGLQLQLQALDLARRAQDRKAESIILNNLAYAYEKLAETQKALQYYQQALDLARRGSDQEHELTCLNNIGHIYRALGDWEKAFDYFERSAKLSLSSGNPALRGQILINLATAYRRHLGQLEQARKILEQALALGREIQSKEVQTFALVNLAALELEAKRPTEAVKHARDAVTLAGSLERETLSRYALGIALRDLGDMASAQAELEKALALAHKQGDGSSEAEVSLALAQVERNRGDLASALSRIQTAIERIESRRKGVVSPELRTSFLASKQDYYELQIDVLMQLHAARRTEGFAADALLASERARARGLLEILNESGDEISLGADPTLLMREQEARGELNARDWYRRELLAGGNPDPKKLAEAEQRLEEALDNYQKVQVALREGNPRYAALTQPQPLDVGEIQRQVLDGEALLLEYSLGSKRSFLWAVGPDSVASFELTGREQIEKAARRYYELLTVRNNRRKGETVPVWKNRIASADAEARKAGRELSGLILQPVEKLLGDRPLLIVADGALQYIPFAALPIPSTGAPLATRHEVVNLPSASVLAVIRREARDRGQAPLALAIFADPVFQLDDERLSPGIEKVDRLRLTQKTSPLRGEGVDPSAWRRLKYSRKEAETIAALLPKEQVFKALDFDASRDTVLTAGLHGYRNLHFATHGVLHSQHPELLRPGALPLRRQGQAPAG